MKKLILSILFLVFTVSIFCQTNGTFDSLRMRRTDKMFFTNRHGSISWFRTSGDTLYIGDSTGEYSLGQLSGSSVTWPSSAGIPYYSGSSSWGNSIDTIGGAGSNKKLVTLSYFNSHSTSGSLSGLTDVSITSIANNQLLKYNTSTSKWENWTPNFLTANQSISLGGILSGSGTTSIIASAASGYYMPSTTDQTNWNGKEPVLGNPSVTGYVLSSTTSGTRSWIAMSGGTSDSSWNSVKIGKGDDTLTIRSNGTLHQFFNHVEKLFTTTWGRITSISIKTDSLLLGNSQPIDTLYDLFNGLPYLKVKAGLSTTNYVPGGSLKEFYTNATTSGTGETDLYSYTLPAYVLSANGDKLVFKIMGKSDATATTPVIKFYIGSDNITLNSSTFGTSAFTFTIEVIRVSSSVCRVLASGTSVNAQTPVYSEFTSKSWTGTNVVKVTGQAATNDVTLRFGYIEYKPASGN